MPSHRLHRASTWAVVGLPLFALGLVLSAIGEPPQADEGAKAHLFQLAVVALAPAGIAYLLTADWTKPVRALWPAALSAVLLASAFVLLFRLEHPHG